MKQSSHESLPSCTEHKSPEGVVHFCEGQRRSEGLGVRKEDGKSLDYDDNTVRAQNGDKAQVDVVLKWREAIANDKSDSRDKKALLLDVIANETAIDVREALETFDLVDIQACISFISNVFSRNDRSKFTSSLIQRALMCVVVLHRRLWRIFLDENRADDDSSTEVNTTLVFQLASASVLDMLLNMMGPEGRELKGLHTAGDVDGLLRRVMQKFSGEKKYRS